MIGGGLEGCNRTSLQIVCIDTRRLCAGSANNPGINGFMIGGGLEGWRDLGDMSGLMRVV